jgi:hypothetical protein
MLKGSYFQDAMRPEREAPCSAKVKNYKAIFSLLKSFLGAVINYAQRKLYIYLKQRPRNAHKLTILLS